MRRALEEKLTRRRAGGGKTVSEQMGSSDGDAEITGSGDKSDEGRERDGTAWRMGKRDKGGGRAMC
jgi:hypothetical protein